MVLHELVLWVHLGLATHPGLPMRNWLWQGMDSHHRMFLGRAVLDVYTKEIYQMGKWWQLNSSRWVVGKENENSVLR
jgi:hypothetical protein